MVSNNQSSDTINARGSSNGNASAGPSATASSGPRVLILLHGRKQNEMTLPHVFGLGESCPADTTDTLNDAGNQVKVCQKSSSQGSQRFYEEVEGVSALGSSALINRPRNIAEFDVVFPLRGIYKFSTSEVSRVLSCSGDSSAAEYQWFSGGSATPEVSAESEMRESIEVIHGFLRRNVLQDSDHDNEDTSKCDASPRVSPHVSPHFVRFPQAPDGSKLNVSINNVFLLGFSQGASMAYAVNYYYQSFKCVCISRRLMPWYEAHATDDRHGRKEGKNPTSRVLNIHGMKDEITPIDMVREDLIRANDCFRNLDIIEHDGGHDVSPMVCQIALAWMSCA